MPEAGFLNSAVAVAVFAITIFLAEKYYYSDFLNREGKIILYLCIFVTLFLVFIFSLFSNELFVFAIGRICLVFEIYWLLFGGIIVFCHKKINKTNNKDNSVNYNSFFDILIYYADRNDKNE